MDEERKKNGWLCRKEACWCSFCINGILSLWYWCLINGEWILGFTCTCVGQTKTLFTCRTLLWCIINKYAKKAFHVVFFFFFFPFFNCVCVYAQQTQTRTDTKRWLFPTFAPIYFTTKYRTDHIHCFAQMPTLSHKTLKWAVWSSHNKHWMTYLIMTHSYDIPHDALTFMAYIMLNLTLHLQHSLLHHNKPHAAATYFAPFCARQITWDSKERSYFMYTFFHLLFWALLTCFGFVQTNWRRGYHVCTCTSPADEASSPEIWIPIWLCHKVS